MVQLKSLVVNVHIPLTNIIMTEPSTHEDTSGGSQIAFMERMIERRREHCEYLGDAVVARIVERYWNEVVLVASNPPPNVPSPTQKCVHILKRLLTVAEDKEKPPAARRKGINNVIEILNLINEAIARKRRAERSHSNSEKNCIPGESNRNDGPSAQDGDVNQSVEKASSVPLHVDATSRGSGSREEHHALAAGSSCSSTSRKSPNHASGSASLHFTAAQSDETQRVASLSKPGSKTVPESKKPALENLGGRWQPPGNAGSKISFQIQREASTGSEQQNKLDIMATANQESVAAYASLVEKRLLQLVEGSDGKRIPLCRIPDLYKASVGSKLSYKHLGYTKLVNFLSSLPLLAVEEGCRSSERYLIRSPEFRTAAAATKPASNPSRWSAPKLGTQLSEKENGEKSGCTDCGSTDTAKQGSTKPSQGDVAAAQRFPSTGAPTTSTQLPGRTSRCVSQENTQDLPRKDASLSMKLSQGRSQDMTTIISMQNATAPGQAPPYQRRSPLVTSEPSVSASHASIRTALMDGRFVPAASSNASQRVLGRSARALLGKSPQQPNSNNSTDSQVQGPSAKVFQGNSTERSNTTSAMPQCARKQLASGNQDHSSEIQAPRSLNAVHHFMAQQGWNKLRTKVVLNVPADVFRLGTNLLYSFSVNKRDQELQLTFQPSPLTEYTALDIHDRLTKWDPYWKPLAYVALGTTSTVSDCLPQHAAGSTAACIDVNPKTNILLDGKTVMLGSLEGLSWGKGHYSSSNGNVKTGDMALLLRMLPLTPNAKKRADCHLWPKGTFLQIQNKPYEVYQRRQQKHDETEWKGMSNHIDLCCYVKRFEKAFTVQMCCYDKELFHYSISVCEYRSPETLFEKMTGNGPESLPKLSREKGLEVAVGFAHREMFVIDGEHEEEDVGKFVFSLCCPFSKTLMTAPVRSTKCKHWQCFDLNMFLNMNSRVTGSRWRCAACEQFVALDDLQICELTSSLLEEFKDVATVSRDRVQFCSDRSYTLLAEQRKRYNKRPSQQDTQGSDVSVKRQKTDHEIIELL